MGKIRVKTLGDEEAEKDSRQARSRSARQKEVKLEAESKKIASPVIASETKQSPDKEQIAATSPTASPRNDKKKKKSKARERSTRYKDALINVDRTKKYSLSEALELLSKVHLAKYDETVELHINTTETLSGTVSLPHGTGKQIRVAIATDELLKEVEGGKINFDVLLAEPAFMSKLAKVARILGPKGLMPNPKTGTVTPNPEETAKKYAGGLMAFKTEAKTPILHVSVGKLSFGDKKITDNIKTLIGAVKKEKVHDITLKSTMSPGIKVDILSV